MNTEPIKGWHPRYQLKFKADRSTSFGTDFRGLVESLDDTRGLLRVTCSLYHSTSKSDDEPWEGVTIEAQCTASEVSIVGRILENATRAILEATVEDTNDDVVGNLLK